MTYEHVEPTGPDGEPESIIAESDSKRTPSTEILDLCKDLELFHNSEGDEFARIRREGHFEVWPIDSDGFDQHVKLCYFKEKRRPLNDHAFREAKSIFRAKAKFDGPLVETFTRVGQTTNAIYLDLTNQDWEAVRVDRDGWYLDSEPEVRFRRTKGMKGLFRPRNSDKNVLNALRELLNINDEGQYKLVLAWLLGALHPNQPYPVLAVEGEQGSCKSTIASLIRSLIDPNAVPLRGVPSSTEDLMIAAHNGWVIALDNLSGVPPWLSDDLCRIASGGGISRRKLYSNDEESLFTVKRPIILTGIDGLLARGDLADRALTLYLPTVDEARRRTEGDIYQSFERIAPEVLGLMLDGVSAAMRNLKATKLERFPRMADFAKWVTSGEGAFGYSRGSTMAEYERNRLISNSTMLDNSVIAPGVISLAGQGWGGTASELHSKLLSMNLGNNSRQFPANPKTLSDALKRLAPSLRRGGYGVEWKQTPGSGSRKMIYLSSGPELSDACDADTQTREMDSVNVGVVGVSGVAEIQKQPLDKDFSDFWPGAPG